jgi:Phosphoglucomutase/phosphomannomutase, alpha/beta/alpha domain I.
MTYLDLYNHWLNHPNVLDEDKESLRGLNTKEIEDAFYTDVKFGTAGMRGLMGIGPNRLNIYTIRKATLAFANYLVKKSKEESCDCL